MIGREPRAQPPVLDMYSDMPLYNTKAVVHHTGVPAPTLRAWERRYGILAPRRGENDYRLYSERDMMLVSWLRERVESGMTISQAIALLRSLEPVRRRGRRTSRVLASAPVEGTVVGISASTNAVSRFALDDLTAVLLRQLCALDENATQRTISQAFAIYPLEEVCLHLFTPVLAEIGQRWAIGELNCVVEHFATGLIRAQLDGLFRSAVATETGPLVLVGCAPGEYHELGALMLALFLRRAGIHVAYLGQNVEVESLLASVQLLKPGCVLLSASLAPQIEGLAAIVERLRPANGGQVTLYFGGQAFLHNPTAVERMAGRYLGTDAYAAVDEIKKRLLA